MAVEGRLRRSPPARPGPRRAALPEADAVNGAAVSPSAFAAPASDGPREPLADSMVAQTVSVAYRVVEDNIAEGRRAAERLRGAGHPAREAALDARAGWRAG
jgi:hypothetical protein